MEQLIWGIVITRGVKMELLIFMITAFLVVFALWLIGEGQKRG